MRLLIGLVGVVVACAPAPVTTTPTPQAPIVMASPSAPASAGAPAAGGATCSPPGTATCDGQGRPIVPGGGGAGASSGPGPGAAAPVAAGVRFVDDVGLRIVRLSSGGTNGLDIDPASGLVYAVSNSTVGAWCGKPVGTRRDLLSVVDPDAAREVAAIATVRGPVWPLAAGATVYVAGSDGVVGIHGGPDRGLAGTIAVGGLPHDLGYDPRSGHLIVSNTHDQSQDWVSVVDVRAGRVIADHRVGGMPHKIVVDPETALAYAMSVGSGSISVVDLRSGALVRQIPSGGGGTLAVWPARSRAFVTGRAAEGPDTIGVVDLATGATSVTTPFLATGGHPIAGMALDERAGLLYATLSDSDLIGVADADTLKALGVFRVAECAWGVKLDVARGRGYVTGAADGTVSIFDLAKVRAALER